MALIVSAVFSRIFSSGDARGVYLDGSLVSGFIYPSVATVVGVFCLLQINVKNGDISLWRDRVWGGVFLGVLKENPFLFRK